MEELEKALHIAQQISVSGHAREKALAAFKKQIRAWDVALPKVEQLVWDFGLKAFYRMGLIECWVANEIEASDEYGKLLQATLDLNPNQRIGQNALQQLGM